MKNALKQLFLIVFILIVFICSFLQDTSRLYVIPIILFLLLFSVVIIFLVIENRNKSLYRVIIAVGLVIMWIVIYTLQVPLTIDNGLYYLIIALTSLFYIYFFIYPKHIFPKENESNLK